MKRALLFLIATVLIGSGASQQNQHYQDSGKKRGAYYKGDTLIVSIVGAQPGNSISNKNEKAGEREAINDSLMVEYTGTISTFTVILAILTGVLAVIGALQLWAFVRSDKSLRDLEVASHNATQKELRAYVFAYVETGIKNVWIPNKTVEAEYFGSKPIERTIAFASDITSGPSVSLISKNYGNTPAYEFMSFVFTEVDSLSKRPTNLDFDSHIIRLRDEVVAQGEIRGTRTVVPAQADVRSSAKFHPLRLYEGFSADSWESKDIALYVFGALVFRDAFDAYWRVDFRFMHAKHMNSAPFGIDSTMYTCADGNKEERVDLNNLPEWWPFYLGKV